MDRLLKEAPYKARRFVEIKDLSEATLEQAILDIAKYKEDRGLAMAIAPGWSNELEFARAGLS